MFLSVCPVFAAATGMSFERSWMMYDDEKKSAAAPFLINFFLYPGLGNYFVGGYFTGTMLLVGYFYSSGLMINASSESEFSLGANGVMLTWIIGMITAFTDTDAYNRKLKKKYGLVASIKPTYDVQGVMLALEKEF